MAQFIQATSNELMDMDYTILWSSTIEKFSQIYIMVEEINEGNMRGEIFIQKIQIKIHEDMKRKTIETNL